MSVTPKHLSDRLRRQIDHIPPAMQAAAKYILDHPAEFGLDPIRTTAANIGISSNVLVRLAQRMGFDGFEAFRAPFRQTLVTDREDDFGTDWLKDLKTDGDMGHAQAEFAQNQSNIVMRSLRLMKPDQVQAAVAFIMNARRCFVTATRASHALAYYFAYTGRMAHPGIQLVPRYVGSAVDDLLDAQANDCLFAITVQPYSAETIQTLRFARKQGLRIVLISDSEIIAPGVQPDVTFTISTRSLHQFACFSGAMAVLECLVGHLFQAGGDVTQRRIERYQAAREDTGAYWQAAKYPMLRRK